MNNFTIRPMWILGVIVIVLSILPHSQTVLPKEDYVDRAHRTGATEVVLDNHTYKVPNKYFRIAPSVGSETLFIDIPIADLSENLKDRKEIASILVMKYSVNGPKFEYPKDFEINEGRHKSYVGPDENGLTHVIDDRMKFESPTYHAVDKGINIGLTVGGWYEYQIYFSRNNLSWYINVNNPEPKGWKDIVEGSLRLFDSWKVN